jgi:hypothetical protein
MLSSMTVELKKSIEQVLHGPYSHFLYGLKASETKYEIMTFKLELQTPCLNID